MLVNGQPIGGSPAALVIDGGRTHPPKYVRCGAIPSDPTLPVSTAGVPYSFLIEARDDFGDPRGFGGDPFACAVSDGERGAAPIETQVDDRMHIVLDAPPTSFVIVLCPDAKALVEQR